VKTFNFFIGIKTFEKRTISFALSSYKSSLGSGSVSGSALVFKTLDPDGYPHEMDADPNPVLGRYMADTIERATVTTIDVR